MKLGRIEYMVIEMRSHEQTRTFKETSHMELNTGTLRVDGGEEGSCKVCLSSESTEEDPLIAPCKCTGSCRFIHLNCLKNWIKVKVKKEANGMAISYNFSRFECEICKCALPKLVKLLDGTDVDLITIDKPSRPYIILESFHDHTEKREERTLHLISPEERVPVRLGRGHQCEIRITDISVSRSHAEIRYDGGRFHIKDLKSKFGTLIKLKEAFPISSHLRVQNGRTVYEFIYHPDKCEVDTEG